MEKVVFFIYAPSYNEKIGGSIVLHKLCDLINKCGGKAYLYPIGSAIETREIINNPILFITSFFRKILILKNFKKLSKFNTPVAIVFRKKNSITIYPEIVSGNPLRANKVVRWLLHKPGFHTGSVEFNSNDLIFYFQEAFINPDLNFNVGGKLQVMNIRTDIYTQTNFGARQGSCYLMRKGKKRRISHDLNNSIIIDDLSHEEVAKIFNKVETFISYDAYTLYSQYAAICGCDSVVVPESGISKEAWQPIDELRYGISYGFNEIQLANQTKNMVKEYLTNLEAEYANSVFEFINNCTQYFNNNDQPH